MASDLSRRALELCEQMLGLDPEKRTAFLDGVCADQPALREEVETLLRLEGEARDFLTSPAPGGSVRSGPTLEAAPMGDGDGDRYVSEGEVARGGMGVIYRIQDRSLNRTIAMKVMSAAPVEGSEGARAAAGAGSSQLLARFLEEAKVTAQLDHPGIVPVHDLGLDSAGRVYFTMKLVKGRELGEVFELAREGRDDWNLPRAVGVMVKVCQAVAYAHAKGVIHRDLKPSNIMAGRFGEVFVMDWGLAKVTGEKDLRDIRVRLEPATTTAVRSDRGEQVGSDSPLVTMDGSVVGTPAYMAPEQAQGRIDEVDRSSDVYSLGAILYSLLTAQPPYVEPGARLSPRTILAAVTQGPPRAVHELNPKAPLELVAICEKAMARAKVDRYPSSLELAEDLQAFLDHRVVRAYRTGVWAELTSWVVRNKGAAALASGLLVTVLLAAFLFALYERRNAVRLRHRVAESHLQRGQALCDGGHIARGLHWLVRGLEEAPETSTELRAVVQENLIGWTRRYNPPVAAFPHRRSAYALAFSPDEEVVLTGGYDWTARLWSVATGEPFSSDGKLVATGGDDGKVQIRDGSTGEPTGVALEHGGAVWDVAFSPDGRRLVTSGRDGKVKLWSAKGEGFREATLERQFDHPSDARAVKFHPQGQILLTGCFDGRARLWSVESGSLLWTVEQPDIVEDVAFSPDGTLFVTGCGDGKARLWITATGERKGPALEHRDQTIDAVAFSPSGKLVLTGARDKTARFWSVETGEPAGPVLEHGGWVQGIAFTPDGTRVVTASRDEGRVYVWSVETGHLLGPPREQPGWAVTVDVSPDGRRLVTNHRIWEPPPPFQGRLEHARLWAEALTGAEMDANGVLSILETSAWRERRRRLEDLGGPAVR
ncbi:MAG: protein kinase [Planctomycetes bacterium]|nr:protein kinase [Planctomycetota bacterium]